MSELEFINKTKCFEGWIQTYSHDSKVCKVKMTFSVYLPPQAEKQKVPVLYWLSGLTCTNENFMIKSGAQRYAAEHGIAIVTPDTSPRGAGIAGEDESWDFGSGAGFYVNATEKPWSDYYNMYDYILKELPELIENNFPVEKGNRAISGHSMGGHGAIVLALNNPGVYKSVSAFAPISAPMQCAWGIKAFTNYLGEDKKSWEKYDSSLLISRAEVKLPILADQGEADNFLADGQLRPDLLVKAAEEHNYPLNLRMRPGYDHSYYFVASFIGEHLEYHAKAMKC